MCVSACVYVCVCEGGSRVNLGEEGFLELHNPGNQARGSSVGGPGVRVERARVPGRANQKGQRMAAVALLGEAGAASWSCTSARDMHGLLDFTQEPARRVGGRRTQRPRKKKPHRKSPTGDSLGQPATHTKNIITDAST